MAEVHRRVVLKPPGLGGSSLKKLASGLATAVDMQIFISSQSAHILHFTGAIEETDSAFFIEHEPAAPALTTADLFDPDRPRADEEHLLRWATALFDALSTAHGANQTRQIVHGGLCGGSLLTTPDGTDKLTDFGFAPAICDALGVESYKNLTVSFITTGPPDTLGTGVWEVVSPNTYDRDDRICSFIDPEKYGTARLDTFESGSDVIAAAFLLHLCAEHQHPYLSAFPDAHRMVEMCEFMGAQRYNGQRRKDLRESSDPHIRMWCDLVATSLARLPHDRPSAAEIVAALTQTGITRREQTGLNEDLQRDTTPEPTKLETRTKRPTADVKRSKPSINPALIFAKTARIFASLLSKIRAGRVSRRSAVADVTRKLRPTRALITTVALLSIAVIGWIFWPSGRVSLDELQDSFEVITSSIQQTGESGVPTHAVLRDFIKVGENKRELRTLNDELRALRDLEGRPAEDVEGADALRGKIDKVLKNMNAYAPILETLEGSTENQISLFEDANKAWHTKYVADKLRDLKITRIKELLGEAAGISEKEGCSEARGALEKAQEMLASVDGLTDDLGAKNARDQIEKVCGPVIPNTHLKAEKWMEDHNLPPLDNASDDRLTTHISEDWDELYSWGRRLRSAVSGLRPDEAHLEEEMKRVRKKVDDLLKKFQDYDGGWKLRGKTLDKRKSLLGKAHDAWKTPEITKRLENHAEITKRLEAAAEKAEENWRCALSLLKQARDLAGKSDLAEAFKKDFKNNHDEIKTRYRERTDKKLEEAKNWLETEAGELPEKWEDLLAEVVKAEKAREVLDSLDYCPGDLDEDGLDYCPSAKPNCPQHEQDTRELIADLLAWTTVDLPIPRESGEPVTIALTFIPTDADGVIYKAFWMSQTEITVAQYREIMSDLPEERGCELQKDAAGRHIDLNPVGCVLAKEAQLFCQELTDRLGQRFEAKIPDSKEWSHALEAGRESYREAAPWICRFDNECRATLIRERVNFYSIELQGAYLIDHSDGYGHFAPVTHYWQNCWMLYNMLGNATEWVSDWTQNRSDPPAWTLGGSFKDEVDPSGARKDYHPIEDRHPVPGRREDIGFRIILRYDRSAVEESPNRD